VKIDNQSATDFSRDDSFLASPGSEMAVEGEDWSNSLAHHQAIPGGDSSPSRIIELEIENARLQRLVTELLIKNQQLRQM
jgi:hypothetical protein